MLRQATFLTLVIGLVGAVDGALAQDGSTYRARNGMIAVGTAQGIDVLSRAGASELDYFCGAGSFAKHRLGARSNDRVVVTRSLGPSPASGKRSVGFEVGAGGQETGGSFLNAGKGIGKSMLVGPAVNVCAQSRLLDGRRD